MPYGTPADMKKHGKGPHMESAKQERKNLMDDNPVTRTAAGDRPWIAKHYKSSMNYGTPMNSGHSPMEAHTPLHKEKLKMVKNEDGEMVPFYAADGKGKM